MNRRLLIFSVLLSFFITFSVWGINEQVIYPGVSVKGIPLGDKGSEEVYQLLAEENRKIGDNKIFLNLPDGVTVTEVTFQAMGLEVDQQRIWEEAYAQGRSGSWLGKFKVRWQLWRHGVELPLYVKLNNEMAVQVLEEAGKAWYVAPQDARFKITAHDEVLFVSEKEGQKIATELALFSLEKQIRGAGEGFLTEPAESISLSLSLERIKPAKTRQDLEEYGVTGLLSKFTTSFNATKVTRVKNIRLASEKLDYFLLPPGEIFSFNKAVGPRTKELGYDEADIIQNYSFVPGVGGGICQVSSTLYNAILLADLEIVERAPHSMVISYVKPGLDATVVYGGRDFRFKNNTDKYLLMKMTVTNGTITCKIFGKVEKGKKVVLKTFLERQIEPTTIYKEDPLIPKEDYVVERKGVPGCVIRVERHIYAGNGKLTKKEVVSKDFYPPIDRVIRSSVDPQSLSLSEVL